MQIADIVVIGQGYAGLCAAREARSRGMAVAAFEAVMVGGAVMTVLELQPSPESFTTSGPDLGAVIGMDNIDAGVRVRLEPVTGIAPTADGWIVTGTSLQMLARQIILATGTRPRRLGVPGEARLIAKGVSQCADCDGPSMIGVDCVVVGAGDAAFQEAAILARFAASVTVVMRGAAPRARADLVKRASAFANVRIIAGRQVVAILGQDRAEGVRLDDGSELRCGGLFPFIGGEPATELVSPILSPAHFDAAGAVLVTPAGAVCPGLWAIGSVRSGFRGGLAEAGEDARRAVAAICGPA